MVFYMILNHQPQHRKLVAFHAFSGWEMPASSLPRGACSLALDVRWSAAGSHSHTLFQGIRARILETLVMLVLLALLTLGMVWVASALIDQDAASTESLHGR